MPAKVKTKTKAEKAIQNKFKKLIEKLENKKSIHYRMSQSFRIDDLIDHDTFGKGIVIDKYNKKIEVLFPDKLRTLVCDR